MSAVCEPEEALIVEPQQAILGSGATMSSSKPSAPILRIVLTGFMGAGKSTVGRLVAERLGWQFLDVDDAITAKAGMPIAEIFAKYGEFVFRRMETSAIAHALGERNAIIALGGGAVEVLANRLLLEQTPKTTVVFLDADLAILLARCNAQAGAAERPNLVAAEQRFLYRAPLYRRVARLRMQTAEQNPEQTAAELMALTGVDGESGLH